LIEEKEKLRADLALSQEKMRSNERGAEEHLKSRLEREKDLLLMDQDQDRDAYQRLLKEYHELEQRSELLEQKLALHEPGHSRSLSNASSGSGHIASTDLTHDDQNIVSLLHHNRANMFEGQDCRILDFYKNVPILN
jgi:myosin-5